jgi:hypothetical protein
MSLSFLHDILSIKDPQSTVHKTQRERPPSCVVAFLQGNKPWQKPVVNMASTCSCVHLYAEAIHTCTSLPPVVHMHLGLLARLGVKVRAVCFLETDLTVNFTSTECRQGLQILSQKL